jgi:ornithine cyclodeaminase/alanine dehydrogenase-like protein (mu-crystallin family)
MLESLHGSMMSLLDESGHIEIALEAGSLGMLRTACAGQAL